MMCLWKNYRAVAVAVASFMLRLTEDIDRQVGR